MTPIITKDKGDLGLMQVMLALTKAGIKLALPVSEHMPFDLIGISNDGKLSRISVKHRCIHKLGYIEIPLRTISSNSKGYKTKYVDFNDIDSFAIFCPDTSEVYFLHKERFKEISTSLILRVLPPKDARRLSNPNINWAKNFTDPLEIFR